MNMIIYVDELMTWNNYLLSLFFDNFRYIAIHYREQDTSNQKNLVYVHNH